MKFFEKVSVFQKIGADRVCGRGAGIQEMVGSVHPFFIVAQMYIANFYRGICNDPNTRDVMRAMSKSNKTSLDSINRVLVFFFFWEMDRWQGHPLFVLPQVRLGLDRIWSIRDESLNELIERFTAIPMEEQALRIWEFIQMELHDTSLSPLFGMIHLGNAKVAAFKQFEKFDSSLPKLEVPGALMDLLTRDRKIEDRVEDTLF